MEAIFSKKKNTLSKLPTVINDDDYYNYASEDFPNQSSKTLFYILISILIIAILAVSLRLLYKDSYWKASLDVLTLFSVFVLILSATSCLLRLIYFFAELENLKVNYDGNIFNTLKNTFDFNYTSFGLIILSIFSISVIHLKYENIYEYVKYFYLSTTALILAASIILCQSVDLFGSKGSCNAFKALEGVDYGSGMAYSYYYGYLRIILPSDGRDNLGLRGKMEQYEEEHHVNIPIKKLFVLIPESGYIPPDLKDASDNWLEGTRSLEHEVRDRAGTKRRTYKNTVYKIHPGGDEKNHRPVYITVEGATPMLTLHEIMKHSHEQTAIYRHNRRKIVAAFYKTLQMLLDSNPDCRDTCELVYYNDFVKGKKVNVGEILLNRIRREAPTCC